MTMKDALKPLTILFGLDFCLLLTWTLADPLVYVCQKEDGSDPADNVTYES